MISSTELERAIDGIDQDQNINGALLVAQEGAVVFEKAYGFASKQLNVANTLDTKFHIASLTKMFVAMAALILFEQGRIDLQAQPATYVPEMKALDKRITLHHLLSHTSGLQEIYDVPNLRFEMAKLKHEHGDFLAFLLNLPQLFDPGERWSYSTTGFILMGYLMERVTELPYAELLQQYLFSPLSIEHTGVDRPRRINAGRASGHTEENGHMVNADNDRLSEIDAPGELYSTVHDLKRWCDAIFDCTLVSPETQQRMFTPYAQVEPSLHYGYGWFLSPQCHWHGGATEGFISRIRLYPEQKASVIILLNSDHVSPETLSGAIEPLILG